jgi:hypothetical protein
VPLLHCLAIPVAGQDESAAVHSRTSGPVRGVLAKVESNTHVHSSAKSNSDLTQEIFMTNPTTQTHPVRPMQVSINDNLPSSSPSPKSTLIGLSCIAGFIVLFALYYNIIGF